ncbi:Pepsin A-1 [Hondaea fermentalgiana]|uniref:Pepsin A-1 n=1 Tax=Hondaea fermentalgiana TaxID=2315210 RepID=A0A2R5GFC5_9STRA|nr:Pepsin A-1 [Hondaea fermentalgiana]|eukprot:GBG29275.1 Pepsin A-1 [Hondaea fermentalgiana]
MRLAGRSAKGGESSAGSSAAAAASRESPGLSKDAKTCLRLLKMSIETAREVTHGLERHPSDDEVAGLRVALTLCSSVLAQIFNPQLLNTFLHDFGFQSWCLILFELLTALRDKINHCNLHGKLSLTLTGPRLRLFFTRIEKKLIAHVDIVQPYLHPAMNASPRGEETLAKAATEQETAGSPPSVSRDRNADLAARLRAEGGILSIQHLIEDEEGCKWWVETFGKSKYAVAWQQFFTALDNHADPKVARLVAHEDVRVELRNALSSNSRPAVTVYQLGDFLFRYGPGLRVALIQLKASLTSPPWFAGALSFDEARCVLTPHPPGTFLIRFSESSVCTWAVSYANALTGVVNHALFRAYVPNEDEKSVFVSGNHSYNSFAELVAAYSAQLQQPAPDVKNIGPARLFRGFLSFDDAEDMLEGHPVGTFLIRFSQSQDGCLVVAYVTPSEGVRQSKIFTDANRGFILGGEVYKRIAALVLENSDKLRIPLAVERSVESLGDPNNDDMDEHNAPPQLGYAALPDQGDLSSGFGSYSASGLFEERYRPLPATDHYDPLFPQPDPFMLGGGGGAFHGESPGMGLGLGVGYGGSSQYETYSTPLGVMGGGVGGEMGTIGYDIPAFSDGSYNHGGESATGSTNNDHLDPGPAPGPGPGFGLGPGDAYDAVPFDAFEHIRALHMQQKLLAEGQNNWETVLNKDARMLSVINASIGGQNFPLALDTGSANTWVTSTSCESETCASHAQFDPAASPTLEVSANKNEVFITFGSGTISATLAKDTVSIGGANPIVFPHQDIMLVNKEEGVVFQTPTFSGLIGLAFKSLAHADTVPILENFVSQGSLDKPQFYFFLGPREQFFAIGEPEDFKDQYLGDQLRTYPIIQEHYWTVKLDDVLFNGKSLLNDDNGERKGTACPDNICKLAFDSGSTLNTMPSVVYKELVRRHRSACATMDAHETTKDGLPLVGNGTLTYVINGDHYVFDSKDFSSDAQIEHDACPALLLQSLDVNNEFGPLFVAGRVFLKRYLSVFQAGGAPNMALAPLNHDFKAQSLSLRETILSKAKL